MAISARGSEAESLGRWAAAAGAVLTEAPDLDTECDHLRAYLAGDAGPNQLAVGRATVEMLRPLLPSAKADIDQAVELGRAWVRGRRSVRPAQGTWAPVVSGRDLDPRTFRRLTGETLIGLLGRASAEVIVATAYLDGDGAGALIPSLRAAARRGVAIEFAAVERLVRDGALDILENALSAFSVRVRRLGTETGFPHLKVLVVDARVAYLGSANFTFQGMSSNFELGALVDGEGVEAIRLFVRSLLDDAATPPD